MKPRVFRPSLWQIAKSYVFPVAIETTSSLHNPLLEVVLRRGRLQLLTENAIYSYADLYDNFSKVFDKMAEKATTTATKRVLVLGFGLGSIPFMLEKKYNQNILCVGVEIDSEIVRLAEKYVLPDLKCEIALFCGDAGDFMAQCNTTFDMICVDLFLDALIPPQFEEPMFLRAVQNALSPEGMLIFNTLAYSPRDKSAAEAFFETRFKEVFPAAILLDVKGNYMLLNRQI